MPSVHQVKKVGGKITCDPNARPELMKDAEARTALWEVIEHSHILMPSTSDLSYLFPDLSEDAAVDRLLRSNAEIVAIKRGHEGATIAGEGERHDFNGHVVEELDPTGAGDCFCGTFVSLIFQGMSLEEAGRRANAAGTIAVTRRGPMEGNSTPQEISTFLTSQENNPRGALR